MCTSNICPLPLGSEGRRPCRILQASSAYTHRLSGALRYLKKGQPDRSGGRKKEKPGSLEKEESGRAPLRHFSVGLRAKHSREGLDLS